MDLALWVSMPLKKERNENNENDEKKWTACGITVRLP